jgi:polyisoprenoid-binding protein YceI
MKTIHYLILSLLISISGFTQDIFQTNAGEVSFYSKTPVEDIDAKSNKLAAALNKSTNKFAFKVSIKSFEFKKALMQEHFNENYMESDKYPKGTFEGEIIDNVKLTENGTYNVKAKGILNIHGVAQERIIDGIVTVKDNEIMINSEFKIKLTDHNIEVPKLVFKNIAEIIDVTINATLKPAVKK